jgi:hypothetical protein
LLAAGTWAVVGLSLYGLLRLFGSGLLLSLFVVFAFFLALAVLWLEGDNGNSNGRGW